MILCILMVQWTLCLFSRIKKSLMKVWGLWNSLGEYQGVSEDIRPWYVPWALASKIYA